jgi:TPR repeat protein
MAQDNPKAKGLLEKVVGQGHAKPAYELGKMYFRGQPVPQDKQVAKNCWQKAAWRFDEDSPDETKSSCEAARLEAQQLRHAAQTGDIKTLERLSKTVVLEIELNSNGSTLFCALLLVVEGSTKWSG